MFLDFASCFRYVRKSKSDEGHDRMMPVVWVPRLQGFQACLDNLTAIPEGDFRLATRTHVGMAEDHASYGVGVRRMSC